MAAWKELLRRAGYLGRRARFDCELEDEIRFHIEARADELERGGLPPAEARQRARREFGSRARASEESRRAWQFRWFEDLWRDLRYGARALARSPGFAAIAILSLGIGVGANYVMFTFVDALLFRPPGIPQPNQVVALVSTAQDSNAAPVSYPDYVAVRDRSHSFQGVAAFAAVSTGLASVGADPSVKDGKLVTDNFFALLGARPELGRVFGAGDDRARDDQVTVLSHACWQEDFGADPAVIGKLARINGIDFTIVGVMPARFTDVDDDLADDAPDFYVPLRVSARIGSVPDLLDNRGQRVLTAFGRLRPGVPVARAQADVATIAGALEREYPETDRDRSLTVRSVFEYRSGGTAGLTAGALAMTLAGMVLLVACANVAGLLTCRAPARAREIAMRLAVGAGRARVVRQLLTESALLAVAGGVAGIVIGYIPIALGKRLAFQFDPQFAQLYPFGMNVRLLVFSMAAALFSVVVFGLTPAFQATRADLVRVMRGAGDRAPRRRHFLHGRHLLVVGQVALALLLLTITTVVYAGGYRSLVTSLRNPGFQVDHLLSVDFDPATVHFKDGRAAQFFQDLIGRLRSVNGVQAAALEYQDVALIRPDSSVARDDVKTAGVWVDEGFFDTLGIPIVEGRAIERADLGPSPAVAIVNDVLARHYWPDQSAVGKEIHLSTRQWVAVVGVAHLNTFMAFGAAPMDTIFLPYGTPNERVLRLVVRATGNPHLLVKPIGTVVHELDPDQAMPVPETWQSSIAVFIDAALLGLDTIGAMGVLGLLLALVGLYGLIAFEVSSRTREIGIRMALGARAGAVVRMLVQRGAVLVGCGIGVGLALTWGLLHLATAILPGSGSNGAAMPPEPNGGSQISLQAGTQYFGGEAFTILVIAVLLVMLFAAYLPARRASRIDPNLALKAE